MAAPVTLHRYAFADDRALEEVSTTEHEFLAGAVYGAAGVPVA